MTQGANPSISCRTRITETTNSPFPKVFDFNDPVDFLNASLKALQASNPKFSLRAWSKQLGLAQAAMLSMVLNRKRRLRPPLSSQIGQSLAKKGKLTETEARYFDMLVLFSNASSLEEKSFYQNILSSLRPDRSFSTLQLDQLRIIADWYHMAILEMTEMKSFSADPAWISGELGRNITTDQAKAAIARLIRLGLLDTNEKGELKKTRVRLATPTDVPNKSLKDFHAEMLQKAIAALETQSVEQRDITGMMTKISKKKLPQAKAMIRDFRRQLAAFLEPENTPNTREDESVYFIGIQLFDLLGGNHD